MSHRSRQAARARAIRSTWKWIDTDGFVWRMTRTRKLRFWDAAA